MRPDLGLNALEPLVAPLLSGHSDLAIGTRRARGARVSPGLKREVISRGYNMILRAGHGPAAAERLLLSLPAWRDAPAASVTALAALRTMFREYKALHGPQGARDFRAPGRAGRPLLGRLRMS